jgi:peroxiredoxin
MSELRGLQLNVDEFRGRDCDILAIVTDPPDKNAKVVADLGLDFRILADPELRVIDTYGLRHDGTMAGAIARPASFLIDRQGVIRWRNLTENYRVRPDPKHVLRELDQMEAASNGSAPPPA